MKAAELLEHAVFNLKTFEEAESLADFLSEICPNKSNVRMGLLELFTNAIEHGNLCIGSIEKNKLQKEGRWLEEINHRLSMPKYKNKKVIVEVKLNTDEQELQVKVTDEGEGFDWKKFYEKHLDCNLDTHGRGILMAKELAFKRLEYSDKGNEVTGFISLFS